jgi:hypothetical protein
MRGGEGVSTGFNYLVSFGGGIGPDVWDKEMQLSAVDIADAVSQAQGRMEECGGWIFMVSQEDYSPSTREKLESENQSLKEQSNVLLHALADCYMLACRRARGTTREGSSVTPERQDWEHVKRFCESTGMKPQILRVSLPTEIQEGETQ